MASFQVRVTTPKEEETRQKFRIACLKNGTSMQKVIYKLMQNYIDAQGGV